MLLKYGRSRVSVGLEGGQIILIIQKPPFLPQPHPFMVPKAGSFPPTLPYLQLILLLHLYMRHARVCLDHASPWKVFTKYWLQQYL